MSKWNTEKVTNTCPNGTWEKVDKHMSKWNTEKVTNTCPNGTWEKVDHTCPNGTPKR
jgi:uncharacterized Fe-S cluster protein YjdI